MRLLNPLLSRKNQEYFSFVIYDSEQKCLFQICSLCGKILVGEVTQTNMLTAHMEKKHPKWLNALWSTKDESSDHENTTESGVQIDHYFSFIPRGNTGGICFISEPANATIYINGIWTGFCTPSFIKDIPNGVHEYVLRKYPYKDISGDVFLFPNQEVMIYADFDMELCSDYFVTTPLGAKIFIDDKDTGKVTPALISDLRKGSHNYKLRLGDRTFVGTFNARTDYVDEIKRNIPPKKHPKWKYKKQREDTDPSIVAYLSSWSPSVIGEQKDTNPSITDEDEPLAHRKNDPFYWDTCPGCGVDLKDLPFKRQKSEFYCQQCGELFKSPRTRTQDVPLKPWKDPESLFCDTEFLKNLIGKEPAKGTECKDVHDEEKTSGTESTVIKKNTNLRD